MIYLEELSRYVDAKKVRWYFNQFDWKNNIQNVEKVKRLGFKVRVCRRWKDSKGKIVSFIMNDAILVQLRKLKDNNGAYIWQLSYQAGEPDRVLGY